MLVFAGCKEEINYPTQVIELSGTWAFELDPDNQGLEENWFTKQLPDNVVLP